jgi:hypothetical protein
MILFQNIVQMFHVTVLAILLKGTVGHEPRDRGLDSVVAPIGQRW